jgi:hypothetical protein
MLAQNLQRKVGKTQTRKHMVVVFLASLCICAFASNSCSRQSTNLRTLMPVDSLVYFESNDLGAVMKAITERPRFREAAKSVPDLSALNGVKLAVAVTGFESKEEAVNDENSDLSFQPKFVAILETNAWNYQAVAFTENKLGEFVNDAYDGEVALETSDKNDGKHFVWTAKDGRKAFALVLGSLVLFSNDESGIDKCLAVKRGESESIAKNSKITDGDNLAFGYVSPDGVAQISNLVGVYMGMRAAEETEVKSFIASVLPGILRNSVKDVSWTAVKNGDQGVIDDYTITLNADVAKVFGETMRQTDNSDAELARYIPAGLSSTTRYNFKDPQIAWRSVVLTASTQTTAINGKLIIAFSASLFEPYAIEDPELFLSAVGGTVQTVTYGAEGEDAAVIAKVKDLETLKHSIAKEIDLKKVPEQFQDAQLWKSSDDEFAFALVNGVVIVGDLSVVKKSLEAAHADQNAAASLFNSQFLSSATPISTLAVETETAGKIAAVISERKDEAQTQTRPYFVETKFNSIGIDRKVKSDFGFIGWIIRQIEKED